jgi:hypothetical protein
MITNIHSVLKGQMYTDVVSNFSVPRNGAAYD